MTALGRATEIRDFVLAGCCTPCRRVLALELLELVLAAVEAEPLPGVPFASEGGPVPLVYGQHEAHELTETVGFYGDGKNTYRPAVRPIRPAIVRPVERLVIHERGERVVSTLACAVLLVVGFLLGLAFAAASGWATR